MYSFKMFILDNLNRFCVLSDIVKIPSANTLAGYKSICMYTYPVWGIYM